MIKRTVVAFYDDQMTHHAAALTYYALMSLFPALLLGVSLLGLLGQDATYDSLVRFLNDFVPSDTLRNVDSTLRRAHDAQLIAKVETYLKNEDTAGLASSTRACW